MVAKVEEINGFQVVPVILQPHKLLSQKDIKHYLYIKKHQSNTNKDLAEKSLFLINPPLNASLNNIRNFIKSISPSSLIENFFINNENLDYEINLTKLTSDLYETDVAGQEEGLKLPNNTSLIVFVDKAAANLAFTKIKKYGKSNDLYQWKFNDEEPASIRFIKKYKDEILPFEETSNAVSQALIEFEQKEITSINELQNLKDVVDEDGFTLVVGKNRKTKKGILGKIEGVTKFKTEETDNKMKKKEKQDFYRFQIREKKKTEMNELLKKFKEDQERIKELKQKKRFRPY